MSKVCGGGIVGVAGVPVLVVVLIGCFEAAILCSSGVVVMGDVVREVEVFHSRDAIACA
jgi:hypothetical protein